MSREACTWLHRQTGGGLDRALIEGLEFRLTEVDDRCLAIVAKAFQVL